MATQISKKIERMVGVSTMVDKLWSTRISSITETKNIQGIGAIPYPEVHERAVRRRFTAEYKIGILKETEPVRKGVRLAPCCAGKGFSRPISLHGNVS